MRKASDILGIIGTAFMLLGGILIIIGYSMLNDNNFYVRIEYYYSHGSMDKTGNNLVTLGFIFAISSFLMLLFSMYLSFILKRRLDDTIHGKSENTVNDVIVKMAGSHTIFDIFRSEDKSRIYSFYRNKTCILKDGEKIYRGKMTPLEWKERRPVLWRITMDFDGSTEDFEVSKVDRNILVKGGSGEEIFYRN